MADEEDAGSQEKLEAVIGDESETVITSTVATDLPLDPPKYEVRPGLGEKFQSQLVQDIIVSSMQEQLMGRAYRADLAPRWAKTIANGIRQRVQDLGMKRYKILVQTTILETKGAGVKCGQRCIWDPETDAYIDDIYRNETIMCHSVVYGVYMY